MKKLSFILLFLLTKISYQSIYGQKYIFTVNGKLPVKKMGTTLIHEHIMVDFIGADSTGSHRWDRNVVVAKALPFVFDVKSKGLKTLFECTPAYVGRDPLILKEISQKTGINIITNTGFYGARKNKFLPAFSFDLSPNQMADVWIKEFNYGIGDSGIRPGFIKIAVDSESVLSPIHEKIVKAAAIAHKATGMTIVSHTGNDGPAMAQLKILKEAGVSPSAFVWTHAQAGTLEKYIEAAKAGAWISIDNINKNNLDKPGGIEWMIKVLSRMKKEKLLNKVLISHDSGWYNVGQPNGGNYKGYTDIFDYLIPALSKKGFKRKDIKQLLHENPMNAYAINIRLLN